jgi:uncharacterized membrane protein YkoI
MRVLRILAVFAFGLIALPAHAEDEPDSGCYSKIEQRAFLARREVVPLAQAIRAVRPEHHGEILRAELCQSTPGGLAYVLTLLSHNGKVLRVTVDASNGMVISGG